MVLVDFQPVERLWEQKVQSGPGEPPKEYLHEAVHLQKSLGKSLQKDHCRNPTTGFDLASLEKVATSQQKLQSGVNPMRFKWAYSYMWRHNAKWQHAEFKDFERHLVALSEKDAVRKLFTFYRLQKKNGNFSIFFWTSGCQKWAFRWGETHIFKSHQMKTSKIKCFFSRPWWLKLVFRWGETPISTLESCACHRKMIMTLKCPFTKSHKYHVSSFWRENLKIKIDTPSQGAVSTAYLVFVYFVFPSCSSHMSCAYVYGDIDMFSAFSREHILRLFAPSPFFNAPDLPWPSSARRTRNRRMFNNLKIRCGC